ncbi:MULTISPECIES: helix-turn-helix domain-containing protein [Pseudomonas]|uniref:Anaerobic benzoate catabolism transcriptional regulator n=1 Tax=Pseudomonas fluorescens TaxID=294 RepID=A0A120FW02_PSEFL|nr:MULTISPECIES: helix-turn-helix domain-containing protein [Pseudomonas]KWV69162.1 anaerobic benzoate catabolism transcriptional regulator [Pseudomonas fluorescens]PRW86044.1 helix-turn-helix domain-containing protein [Pseudomonas fluorescens]
MSLSEAFAVVIRALRQNSGMSQDDLSLLDRSYLSRVERGKGNVSIEMLLKISKMLDTEPTVLMLLTTSCLSEEATDVALERISRKLEALKETGVIELISSGGRPRRHGRPSNLAASERLKLAPQLKQKGLSNSEIARELDVSKSTVQRFLAKVPH